MYKLWLPFQVTVSSKFWNVSLSYMKLIHTHITSKAMVGTYHVKNAAVAKQCTLQKYNWNFKGLFSVEFALSLSSYRHSTQIFRKKSFKYNVTGLKTPTGRRQLVGYLQVWPRIWTRNNWEQIQQVARAGLEPGNAGLQVRCTDHLAMLPPILQQHTL